MVAFGLFVFYVFTYCFSAPINYYEILGVSRDATQKEIKKAFRDLGAKWHPDRATPETKDHFEAKFASITEAYRHLGDAENRHLYDLGKDETPEHIQLLFDANEAWKAKNLAKSTELYRRYREIEKGDDGLVCYRIGTAYLMGEGVTKDLKTAVDYFQISAQAGNSEGQYNVGYMYETGTVLEKSNEKAFKYYELAYKQGDIDAHMALGRFYELGLSVQRDNDKALEIYEVAADAGNINAQKKLVQMYIERKNAAKTAKYLEKVIESGEEATNEMLVTLAKMYETGAPGLPADFYKSLDYWKRVALTDPAAEFRVAYLNHIRGNTAEALEYYGKVQEEENPMAHTQIGLLYKDSPLRDGPIMAREYFERAQKGGDPMAFYQLGLIYEQGTCGVEKDLERSKEYYKFAVEKKLPVAVERFKTQSCK